MDENQSSPYAASSTCLDGVRRSRTPLLECLALALIFTLSFFFIGVSLRAGVSFAWRYTLEMFSDFWFLVGQVFIFHAGLQRVLLPRLRLKHCWLPMIAGITSMLGFNLYYDIFSSLEGVFAMVWIDLMAVAPVVIGILIEVSFFVATRRA